MVQVLGRTRLRPAPVLDDGSEFAGHHEQARQRPAFALESAFPEVDGSVQVAVPGGDQPQGETRLRVARSGCPCCSGRAVAPAACDPRPGRAGPDDSHRCEPTPWPSGRGAARLLPSRVLRRSRRPDQSTREPRDLQGTRGRSVQVGEDQRFRDATRAANSLRPTSSFGPRGSLLSRIPTPPGSPATSTQLSPASPLRDDLRQVTSIAHSLPSGSGRPMHSAKAHSPAAY